MTAWLPEGRPNASGAQAPLYLSIDPIRPDEAWAFAQFLKRARWDHYRALAVSADEATAMQGLAEQLRQAFAEQGYAPR